MDCEAPIQWPIHGSAMIPLDATQRHGRSVYVSTCRERERATIQLVRGTYRQLLRQIATERKKTIRTEIVSDGCAYRNIHRETNFLQKPPNGQMTNPFPSLVEPFIASSMLPQCSCFLNCFEKTGVCCLASSHNVQRAVVKARRAPQLRYSHRSIFPPIECYHNLRGEFPTVQQ